VKIAFHPVLHNRMVRLSVKQANAEMPVIFLMGKTRAGVVKRAVMLEHKGDCYYFPTPCEKSIALAYAQLSKRKLIPCGFAKVCGQHGEGPWEGYGIPGNGGAIFAHSGVPFVDFGYKRIIARFSEEGHVKDALYAVKR
jgi:hypothetical protein